MRRDTTRGPRHSGRPGTFGPPPSGNQLTLLADQEWRLDDHTREIGRQGLAEARAALAAARQRPAAQHARAA